MPHLYLIAGPNGAGKTTFASRFLPEFVSIRQFVNSDLIAAGLSPFAPESAAIEAGRLMLKRADTLIQQRTDFGIETTLASKTLQTRLRSCKAASYRIYLAYLWLANRIWRSSVFKNGFAGEVTASRSRPSGGAIFLDSETSLIYTCLLWMNGPFMIILTPIL